jgi:hypothetical protein
LSDSVGTPKLIIPDKKVFRDLALLEFLMRGSRTVLCSLALAMVVGTLQSLVSATPNAIGDSLLHHIYRNIHNETLEIFYVIQHFYQSGLALGDLAQADFSWWEQALASGLREHVHPIDLCTYGITWGDRSGRGSGIGSTFEWVESGNGALPTMEAWMGAWNGTVQIFTSNWRELRTVVETLKREEVFLNRLRGRMVFYLTDNEAAFNICKKVSSKTLSLHILVQHLKALELALGCRLEVIHVPGTTTITQLPSGTSILILTNILGEGSMMDVRIIGLFNMSMQQLIFLRLVLGGGWLRAAETFALDDEDVEIITPANGALHNLSIGVGGVLLPWGLRA